MFRSMPFILLVVIISILLLNPVLPLSVKQILLAMSLTVKSGIIFVLPIIIFSLLFKTMVSLASKATAVIALIIACVCCSNFLSTFVSHFIGEWVYHLDLSIIQPKTANELIPAWSLQMPKLIDNNKAMFAGIILGIVLGSFRLEAAQIVAKKLDKLTFMILDSFKFLIPVFVAGCVVKLQYDGVMEMILKDYAAIFCLIALAQFLYISLAFLALNNFNVRAALKAMKNFLPAALAGFSTMSSAAVMPLTIEGAANNAVDKDLARAVVPCTVNIHLLGDCIAIPIFAYALMKSFAMPEPALVTYLIFVCYFVIAKFSVAAVPGGGIIVMLPVLESHLGFTPEMLSLMTALYILFDPVVTCANVLGNGAFAKLIDRMMGAWRSRGVNNELVIDKIGHLSSDLS
jgi:Na+/H+-dicarboxylate symporter